MASIVGNPGHAELDKTDTVLVLLELNVYYSSNVLSTFVGPSNTSKNLLFFFFFFG